MRRQQRIMVPEAFKVLPPLSPELPAPPRAPQPHRVAPPIMRREKTAFVILNDEKPPPSRGTSPSGRVSPFRGKGFREESTIRYSREPSPSPEESRGNEPRSRSRSRLPVAAPRGVNGSSTSSSPVRGNTSGIPKPINRRNSLSPNRATQVLNQVNRNTSLLSPTHNGKATFKPGIQSPRHISKPVVSPKRVGPVKTNSSVLAKPPLPKSNQTQKESTAQKENDKKINVTSPYRRKPQPNKPDVTRSPSRIPRTRSISRGRGANVRPSSPHTSPARAVVRHSPRVQQSSKKTTTLASNEKKNGQTMTNGEKKPTMNGEKNGQTMTNGEKKPTMDGEKNGQTMTNGEKKPTMNAEKNGSSVEKKNGVNGAKNGATPVVGSANPMKNGVSPEIESAKPDLESLTKLPIPVEAVVSTVSGSEDKTPELEKKEIQETPVEVQPQPQPLQSPPLAKPPAVSEKKPVENGSSPETPKNSNKDEEEVPEPTLTLVRTTTAPALELAQPDVIPTILSKGEQEISKSISEGPSVEVKSENPGELVDTVASVESVRSMTSVETVRAVARVRGVAAHGESEVEVLSANNLMKADGNNRNIAWDSKTPDMSPLNNSVHPLDPVLPLQPPKKRGCCGRLTDKLCCKSCGNSCSKLCSCMKTPACCTKLGSRLGVFCSKLNFCKNSACCKKLSCSCCKKKEDVPPVQQKRSRMRECLSRINCFRWSKCCKRQPRPQEVDLEEGRAGCCAGCKKGSRRCYSALFCLNLACCQKMRMCCRCTRLDCCRTGGCCGPTPTQLDRRKSRMSVRKSQTSISTGMPKLDPTLVEHQSMMRGAVPVLPLPLAWMCCILNIFLPGTGTLLSGVFCMCFGKPRFSVNDSYPSRLGSMCINLVVAVSQLFTVLFCLVGWGWSIWWGVMMVKFARKQKRISLAEKSAEQPAPAVAVNQNHDVERSR